MILFIYVLYVWLIYVDFVYHMSLCTMKVWARIRRRENRHFAYIYVTAHARLHIYYATIPFDEFIRDRAFRFHSTLAMTVAPNDAIQTLISPGFFLNVQHTLVKNPNANLYYIWYANDSGGYEGFCMFFIFTPCTAMQALAGVWKWYCWSGYTWNEKPFCLTNLIDMPIWI